MRPEEAVMLERRSWKRTHWQRGRVWVGAPIHRWAQALDASNGGIRLVAPEGVGMGCTITIYLLDGNELGPGRAGTVVHKHGRSVGIEFARHLAMERRGALRRDTRGIRAWLSGPVETLASVRNLSATGAEIEPILPLRHGVRLTVSIFHGSQVVATRDATVVRTSSTLAAVRFLMGKSTDRAA